MPRRSAQAHACGPRGRAEVKLPTTTKRPANRTLGPSDAMQARQPEQAMPAAQAAQKLRRAGFTQSRKRPE